MIRIDMHVHSVFSDGTCTVEEIVHQSARRGIAVLALSDHDTLDGLDPFVRACERYSIRPIRGVELSSKYSCTAHILGYRLSRPEPLKDALVWVLNRRNERNRLICERLREQGVEISIEDVEREARGRVVARPHFASALVNKGLVPDIAAAFTKYLARGGSAYIQREAYTPADCVKIIRDSGGLPVLAHPSLTGMNAENLGNFLEELKYHGLWGLECVSSHCSSEKALMYFDIADKHSLFPTAGSDFHGGRRPGATLGVQVSETFLPWARLGVTL